MPVLSSWSIGPLIDGDQLTLWKSALTPNMTATAVAYTDAAIVSVSPDRVDTKTTPITKVATNDH